MSHQDDDLDDLLRPLKNLKADDLQVQKWQLAVQREARKRTKVVTTTRTRWAFQLIAAMLIGFVIGALVFKELQSNRDRFVLTAQFSDESATFEHSHVNLD